MTEQEGALASRWRPWAEAIGTVAVVVSLVYVGVQIRQNTAAVQTSTSHDIYALYQDRLGWEVENPDVAELRIRVERSPQSVTAADSLRYEAYVNQRINLLEFVWTSREQGTLSPQLADAWLQTLSNHACLPWAETLWTGGRASYVDGFRVVMDGMFAAAECR